MKQEVAHEAVKSSPAVAVAVSTWMGGLTLNEYVLLATLGYIGLQAVYLMWKWYREWKGKK